MFELRSTRNTRVDGHVSAHGMPDGARVISCVVRLAPAHDPGPLQPPGGTEVLLSSLAPAREGVA